MTGKAMGQTQYDGSTSGKQRFGVMPKGDVGQGYGRGAFGRTSQKNYNSGPRYSPPDTPFSSSDNQKLSSCSSGGATAISVAVGRWNMVHQVVQAYSMFCANGFDPSVIDEGTNARPQ